MDKLPKAIFILNLNKDTIPALEARAKGIPVIAVVDTNADPQLADYTQLADYIIPANDDAIQSVKYVLGKVKDVITTSKK